jgi:DNA-binding transcriptional LysR family regulator
MELNTMQYVVSVARHLNFTLAAQDCNVTQSALSQQISKLEKNLGVPLFYRNAKGVALTEAGEVFSQRALEILQLTEALQAEMSLYSGACKGTLNLGIITSLRCIDFGDMLSAFCSAYPNVSVNIMQDGSHNLAKRLLERKIDLAFLNRPISNLHPGLKFVPLGEDVYSLAVSAKHPLAKRKIVSLKELREEKFIFHRAEQVASELCLAACRSAGFEPNIVCRSANPTTGLYMVQGGLGVALLPSEEFRDRALPGVLEIKLKERIVKEVGVAWRRDLTSPLIETMVRFSQDWV